MSGWIDTAFSNFSVGDWIGIAGIIVGAALSIILYELQRRLSDRQKLENRLEIERQMDKKLYDIEYKGHNSKIQLYNIRFLGKGRFTKNKRSFLWGYPYHAAELYAANFDGLEFVVGIEEWNSKKYYKVGVIDYQRILGVRPEGDGLFNGVIFYVKPKLLQLDKYSIAYKSFRYYSVDKDIFGDVTKPIVIKLRDGIKRFGLSTRYNLWLRWKVQGGKQ